MHNPKSQYALLRLCSSEPKAQLKDVTLEEISKHNTEKDCWVVVGGKVLNVTDFLKDHPGGKKAIMIYAGRDATEEVSALWHVGPSLMTPVQTFSKPQTSLTWCIAEMSLKSTHHTPSLEI